MGTYVVGTVISEAVAVLVLVADCIVDVGETILSVVDTGLVALVAIVVSLVVIVGMVVVDIIATAMVVAAVGVVHIADV